MIFVVVFVLALRIQFVGAQCKVDEIQLKEDFNPYHYEGKWYLISMTRLWGIDFSPRNFTNSTGRTSWGDNANKFFGRWTRKNNGSSSWGNWRRRGENGTTPRDVTRSPGGMGGQTPWGNGGRGKSRGGGWSAMQQGEPSTNPTSGYPKESINGEGWLRKSDGTSSPNGSPADRTMRPSGGRRGPPSSDGGQHSGRSGGSGGADFRNGSQRGDWSERSEGSPSTQPGRRQRGWSSPRSVMSKRFKEIFNPKNFQMETSVREDNNIDMFIVAEFFGRCIFTKGQGSIVNPRNTAKLEVNFPVRWFLPCQPFWIVDTDYVGYSVVYFCLEVLDDGTCDPDSVTVWTFNRKMTGHTKQEMDKVRTVLKNLCVNESDLTVMSQTEYCPIEDENVQNQRNSKPTIHCNNADQRTLRITLDSPYDTMSPGNNAASSRSFSPKVFPTAGLTFISLLVGFFLCRSKSMILR